MQRFWVRLNLFNNFCYAAILAILEPDFDAAGVIWGAGEQGLYYACGKATGALIFL